MACVSGHKAPCSCGAGLDGSKACDANGAGYEMCSCPPVGGGGGGGAGGSVGGQPTAGRGGFSDISGAGGDVGGTGGTRAAGGSAGAAAHAAGGDGGGGGAVNAGAAGAMDIGGSGGASPALCACADPLVDCDPVICSPDDCGVRYGQCSDATSSTDNAYDCGNCDFATFDAVCAGPIGAQKCVPRCPSSGAACPSGHPYAVKCATTGGPNGNTPGQCILAGDEYCCDDPTPGCNGEECAPDMFCDLGMCKARCAAFDGEQYCQPGEIATACNDYQPSPFTPPGCYLSTFSRTTITHPYLLCCAPLA